MFNNTVTSRCGVDKRGDNFFAGFLTMLNLCEYFGEYLDRFTAWISDLVSAIQFVNNVVVLWKLATTITCTNSSPVLGQFIVILLIMKITQQWFNIFKSCCQNLKCNTVMFPRNLLKIMSNADVHFEVRFAMVSWLLNAAASIHRYRHSVLS